MAENLKKTPFHRRFADAGARMVPFAGYEMAVQIEGVVAEHTAVRERVGVFDVSHMGEVVITGPEAHAAVQYLITNDLGRIEDRGALYTVMCDDDGGVIDDLIVYRDNAEAFMLVVNGSRREADVAHMRRELAKFDCVLDDQSDSWALLAVQGPRSQALFEQLFGASVADLDAFQWCPARLGEADVRVARTGYTGEDGFELYVPVPASDFVWQRLVEAGKDFDLALCGLGARDTLRLEVKFPLYGNDLDLDHNPYESLLGWTVKLGKGDFVGRAALERIKEAGPARKWVGFKMEGRGIPRQGYDIAVNGAVVGNVTSGTHSPTLGEPIGVGYVPTEFGAVDSAIEIIIRGKAVPARIVKTPFYKRGK